MLQGRYLADRLCGNARCLMGEFCKYSFTLCIKGETLPSLLQRAAWLHEDCGELCQGLLLLCINDGAYWMIRCPYY